ncbi:MAG: flavodoxin family protein [Aminipila sp.]
MKVVVVLGSPRKKDSYQICKEIEAELKKNSLDIEFEYLHLNAMNIMDCKGCSFCFQKSEALCPCKEDDILLIKEKLKNSDGIVIASPVYAYQVTGQMKRFIDRMSYLFHRQELCGKPAIIVVTTDGGGSKQVYKYLRMTLSGWAMDVVGNIQIISPMFFKNRQPKSAFGYDEYTYQQGQKKIKTLSQELYKKMIQKNKKVPTFYDIYMFNCLRSKTYTSYADRTYWKEKGWLDAPYFYDVTMSPIKKFFGSIIKRIIHLAGKRYLKGSSDIALDAKHFRN